MQARVDGATLTYDVRGTGNQAIVFLPALGTSIEMWRAQVSRFSREYTVVTCDSAGHEPFLPETGETTLDRYRAGVLAVMDAVGIPSAHVIGISMGGMIAQLLGIHNPDRVSSLVLVCTTSGYPPESRAQLRERADLVTREGMELLIEPTIGRWFTPDFIARNPETVDWIRGMLRSAQPASYAATARAVAATDTTSKLPTIGAPVLVLGGEHDETAPPGSMERLTSQIPVARGEVVARAAHLCNVQEADEVNRLIGEFVAGVARERGEAGVFDAIAPW